MKSKLIAVSMLALAALSSCAPGLGHEMPVTRFPDPASMVTYRAASGRVLVRPFVDGRSDPTVGTINGRPVGPAEDVAASVRGAMENFLKAAGFDLGGIKSPAVTGTVERWAVDVHPGFPTSKVDSSATLTLEVTDPSGQSKFRGTYRGEFSTEHPLMDEDRIAEALGQSMAAAMQEAIRDPRFTDLLRD